MYLSTVITSLALVCLGSAHFLLNYPPTLGFDDSTEGSSPCGNAAIKFGDNDTAITVGGFPIALQSTHPQAQWLYRATLSQQQPFNWTNIVPVVQQSGLGDFCLPALSLPSSFANHSGLVQVIQSAVDGLLYQCSAVKFVSGPNSSVSETSCTNATGVTASLTTQSNFTSSVSGSPSSATSKALAAQATGGSILVAGLGAAALAGLAAL